MIQIGIFRLDEDRLELTQGDTHVHCEPQVFDLIMFLVRNSNRVVTKDELIEAVWKGRIVSDATISGCIADARRALGDTGRKQEYIKTIHGRGFRFVGPAVGNPPANHATPRQAQELGAAESRVSPGPPVIAVVSFSLVGTNETHEAIAEAIPSELIAALSRQREFKIIARGSSFRFNSSHSDPRDIRRQLNAQYVLSGTVELASSNIRVSVELTDTGECQVIWSEIYSSSLDDVFVIREKIVREVATAVEQYVPFYESKRQNHIQTEMLDAWGHYHRAVRHLYRFNKFDNNIAEMHFQRASELDPSFARAYAGLSYTQVEKYNLWGVSDQAVHLNRAKDMAEKAIELDPFDPFCNLVLSRAKWIDRKLYEAMSWVDRSIGLNPNYAFALFNSGKFRAFACEANQSDELIQTSIGLSPIDPHLQSMLCIRAIAAFAKDDSENAVHHALKSLNAPNPHLLVCVVAAIVFNAYGHRDYLQMALSQIKRLDSKFSRERFLSVISLTDTARQNALLSSLESLGLE